MARMKALAACKVKDDAVDLISDVSGSMEEPHDSSVPSLMANSR